MLSSSQCIAFVLLALASTMAAAAGFRRVFTQIRMGSPDPSNRTTDLRKRILYALRTTLFQSRVFRKRCVVSIFHSFIFYGFVVYLLVNLVDAAEGFFPFTIRSTTAIGAAYNLVADTLSALVLVGVVALVIRRFAWSHRAFVFNPRTSLHPRVARGKIWQDSAIVSAFILVHVGSRALEAAAKLRLEGHDTFQPFASLLMLGIAREHAHTLMLFGYWGALGSVFLFLGYFPYSKHIHIFAAPVNYVFARRERTGTLSQLGLNVQSEAETLGAGTLRELSWPRLLDAYACIQCNRCQDVCPAAVTGKSLSPSAIEINKRMLLNEQGIAAGDIPLLSAVLNDEALWACTTCGACMQVCPTQDEQMLDIVDVRRHQVMVEGKFPHQLQAAFRGMERTANPWGLSRDRRLDWAQDLHVLTIEENPQPDILYWVGCAASYDPQAQSTARALVRLLEHAGVSYAVLGKAEGCTGDSARRAGNEFLYQHLAKESIATLDRVSPKRIVASCPHCLNSLHNEFPQIGGNYEVVHHSAYLEELVEQGRLSLREAPQKGRVTFHDPCYLGRHNGVFDPPRNVLRILGQDVAEMPRSREESFCCGAGGAQFWKEEEPGGERIASNRIREAQSTLGKDGGTVAVGCPFCKSMLSSALPEGGEAPVAVYDIAELLAECIDVPESHPLTSPIPFDQSFDGGLGVPISSTGSAIGPMMDAKPDVGCSSLRTERLTETIDKLSDVSPPSNAESSEDVLSTNQVIPSPTFPQAVRKPWTPKSRKES